MPDIHLDALPIGTELLHYKIIKILGQGAFGITYLARDNNLHHMVAIKEYLFAELARRDTTQKIRPKSESCRQAFDEGIDRFILEARTLAKFNHPNIVRVHTFFQLNGTAYMVMDYEEGQDLADLLKKNQTLAEDEILDIIIPLLHGLQQVHAKKILHRDIKPSNIFIRKDGTPVLLDFGSARQKGSDNLFTTIITPGYAPYENYTEEAGKQGPWSDLYSLGSLAYRAVAGKPPADSSCRSAAKLNKEKDPLTPATTIGKDRYSRHFLKAIDHALILSEQKRPQSVSAWITELLGPDGERSRHPAGTAKQPVRFKREIVLTAIVVSILLILFSFYSFFSHKAILTIKSDPEGAEVKLDNVVIGKSPLHINDIPSGPHLLQIQLKYHQPYSEEIVLAANSVNEFNPLLSKGSGTLTIKTTPPGALIYLNGKELSQKTPGVFPDLPAGPHKLRIHLDWFKDELLDIDLLHGEEEIITITLPELPPKKTWREPITGMEFVWIPEGCFGMGSPDTEKDRVSNEGPQHDVCLDGFWMGQHEVTQAQWEKIMGSNPSQSMTGANYPVEQISWNMVQMYIQKLTETNKGQFKFRLPSEAEWEYSCRAGTSTPFYFGETISPKQVNFTSTDRSETPGQTTLKGSFPPNIFGLYDMHGNVWEWTSDCYDENFYSGSFASQRNPISENPSCRSHTLRSGSWYNGPDYLYLRCASRINGSPDNRFLDGNGFRLTITKINNE